MRVMKLKEKEIRGMNSEQLNEYINYITKKKIACQKNIMKVIKGIIFLPLSIGIYVVALVARLIGTITSIGLPYGIYCVYKVVRQLQEGIALAEIDETVLVIVFFIIPFGGFVIYYLGESLSRWLRESV